MSFFFILPNYLVWHYSYAFNDIKNIWKNFVVFVYHFFSVPTLLSTLFSPWMRINDRYSSKESLVNTLIFNLLLRFFGVFVRSIFIVLGIVALLLTIVIGALSFMVWAVLPIVLLGVLGWSLQLVLF